MTKRKVVVLRHIAQNEVPMGFRKGARVSQSDELRRLPCPGVGLSVPGHEVVDNAHRSKISPQLLRITAGSERPSLERWEIPSFARRRRSARGSPIAASGRARSVGRLGARRNARPSPRGRRKLISASLQAYFQRDVLMCLAAELKARAVLAYVR
jgi:hypothetical protein